MNGLTQQSIIERPAFLTAAIRLSSSKALSISKIAMDLKKIKKTQCMSYGKDEFEKEFFTNRKGQPASTGKAYFIKVLNDNGIKKPRLILDNGTYYLFSNDND